MGYFAVTRVELNEHQTDVERVLLHSVTRDPNDSARGHLEVGTCVSFGHVTNRIMAGDRVLVAHVLPDGSFERIAWLRVRPGDLYEHIESYDVRTDIATGVLMSLRRI